MGQFCSPSRGDPVMLKQAIVLYQIAKLDVEHGLDEAYLVSRF
jgi:hypothetical protein